MKDNLIYQLLITLEMVVDISMKAVGIYYFFFKLDVVNGSLIIGMSALWTMMVILSKMWPHMVGPQRMEMKIVGNKPPEDISGGVPAMKDDLEKV